MKYLICDKCKKGKSFNHEHSIYYNACYLCPNCLDDNKWISVEDRLPDKEGKYLCFVKVIGIRIRGFYKFANKGKFKWWCNCQETKKVTHWMDLPEIPE